jgi:hypothetical protein
MSYPSEPDSEKTSADQYTTKHKSSSFLAMRCLSTILLGEAISIAG